MSNLRLLIKSGFSMYF